MLFNQTVLKEMFFDHRPRGGRVVLERTTLLGAESYAYDDKLSERRKSPSSMQQEDALWHKT